MLVFPYIRNVSETINSAIDKKEYTIGYRILNKLTNFIKRHKDQNKYNNNIVYKILCNNCNGSYVGQTKRYLKTYPESMHPEIASFLAEYLLEEHPAFRTRCARHIFCCSEIQRSYECVRKITNAADRLLARRNPRSAIRTTWEKLVTNETEKCRNISNI